VQALGNPPAGFALGVEYTKEEIDAAIQAGSRQAAYQIVPEQDLSGHGTQVAGIAAGNGRSSGGRYRGVAPESDLIIVKLGVPREDGFPRTTELMQAIDYVIRKAEAYQRPVAVNLSFGNAYGSHRGTSLLEEYIDQAADRWQSSIAVGTGNEGNTGGHAGGQLQADQPTEIEFVISDFETSMNLQLWKNYADDYRITLISPSGRSVDLIQKENSAYRYQLGDATLLVYYGTPSPYQIQQEIFIDFIPDDQYLDSGIWKLVLTPEYLVTGDYEVWMPDAKARSTGTRFLKPSPETTMTIPATAHRVVAVGAYDARRNAYASFSGRGWPDSVYQVRPDLVAPGVSITTTAAGGGYISVTGTSFATPFVTGAAAMLMQWGIVNGNDTYLYGEKLRAYLRRGARPMPGFKEFPNNQVGYGRLCVQESIPG
jgi:subtilisin family serine protease